MAISANAKVIVLGMLKHKPVVNVKEAVRTSVAPVSRTTAGVTKNAPRAPLN